MSDIHRMKTLVQQLSQAAKAYYQEDREVMSNHTYDRLYDELVALEASLGTILAGSPTQKVGYELLSALPKERHDARMLSLDKTKERDAMVEWIGDEKGLLSWKLDGLTIVLTYEEGVLVKGITRGNGEVGEVITNNVRVFENVPLKINLPGKVVVRGEAVIKYSDFEAINAGLAPEDRYKNPRNLCSGTVRQLNNEITAQRHVHYMAFQLVSGGKAITSKLEQLAMLEACGFDVVTTKEVTADNMAATIDWFAGEIEGSDIATDGLVLTYDSIPYSQRLGATSKFPRDSMAFKWQDTVKTTHLVAVDWSASRTGLINPVAIFEPVELEGTTVTRASLHNISIVEGLALGIGDAIDVYKANMIIPQVAENHTRSHNLSIPTTCPVCHEPTEIQAVNDVKMLFCQNPKCSAKAIKNFAHFVSRNGMNIEGMSEATIEKCIAAGLLHQLGDIFRLKDHQATIEALEGFGPKSYEKLVKAIEESRVVAMDAFIYALAIPNVGPSNARLLCKHFAYDLKAIRQAVPEAFEAVEGYGEIIAKSLYDYFHDEEKTAVLEDLLNQITLETPEVETREQTLTGKVFVITGSLVLYENRKALKAAIEALGGKVTGTVTGKTDYLINNNVASTSGKNKKAKELGVPIIDEEAFRAMRGGNAVKITREQVEHVANLARLNLTEEEKDTMTKDMAAIIGFADEINALDIADVKPTAHVLPINNVFRDDVVAPSMDREKLLSNAPNQENGCYSVPKVVE